MTEVSRILSAIGQGDRQATDQLFPLVYEELRQLAARKLGRERPGQTLTATALVHEAFLRLVGSVEEQTWENRRHFFGAAAEAMRRILVESARKKHAGKRGGGVAREELDMACLAAAEPVEDLLALDEALDRLAAADPAAAEVVHLRFFAGLTVPQTAEALGVSVRTADRLWAYARAWLYREIRGAGPTA
jgi:RNA polymerase sigma factor (TIGR02999 family)